MTIQNIANTSNNTDHSQSSCKVLKNSPIQKLRSVGWNLCVGRWFKKHCQRQLKLFQQFIFLSAEEIGEGIQKKLSFLFNNRNRNFLSFSFLVHNTQCWTYFDTFNLILFMPEEGKPETSYCIGYKLPTFWEYMSVGVISLARNLSGWNMSGQELVRGEVVPPGTCPYGYLSTGNLSRGLSGGKLSTQELVRGEVFSPGICPWVRGKVVKPCNLSGNIPNRNKSRTLHFQCPVKC